MWAEHHQGSATCGEEPWGCSSRTVPRSPGHGEVMEADLTSLGRHLGEEGVERPLASYPLQGCSPAGALEEDNLSGLSSPA